MSAQVGASTHPLGPWLRTRVLTLRGTTTRRLFAPSVELVAAVTPRDGQPVAVWRYAGQAQELDHGLRVDVLVRLLTDCAERGTTILSAVHVRPGHHDETTDLDHAWLRAAIAAADVSGTEVTTLLAVSRWGWHDLRTGAKRTWVRLRSH
jgi:hypothetical protein